jgi:Uma2 family endonuclease
VGSNTMKTKGVEYGRLLDRTPQCATSVYIYIKERITNLPPDPDFIVEIVSGREDLGRRLEEELAEERTRFFDVP